MKRLFLLIILSFTGLFAAVNVVAQGVDKGCSPTVANPCTSSGSGGNTPSGPSIWDTFRANREAAAREKSQREAVEANDRGVALANKGDYVGALRELRAAAEKDPDNQTIQRNIAKVTELYNAQIADEAKRKIENDRQAKLSADAAKNMTASMQNMADSLTAAPTSNDLVFGDPKNSNLKDAPNNTPSSLNYIKGPDDPCKPNSGGLSFGDPMTVDARCVPSGLTKTVEDSIEKSFAKSPPGVGERVRKGFQALMTKDRDAAKLWFNDALKRDPNNEELKRLVDLIDYTLKCKSPPKVVQLTAGRPLLNEDELLSLFPKDEKLQLPQPSGVEFLFDVSEKTDRLQLPEKDDSAFLFIDEAQKPATVVTFVDSKFKVYQLKVDSTVYFWDGPYIVQPDGGFKRSTDPVAIMLWKYGLKEIPENPPSVTKKP